MPLISIPYLSPDPTKKLFAVERLLNVIISATVEAHHNVIGVTVGRDHNNGNGLILVPCTDLCANL